MPPAYGNETSPDSMVCSDAQWMMDLSSDLTRNTVLYRRGRDFYWLGPGFATGNVVGRAEASIGKLVRS